MFIRLATGVCTKSFITFKYRSFYLDPLLKIRLHRAFKRQIKTQQKTHMWVILKCYLFKPKSKHDWHDFCCYQLFYQQLFDQTWLIVCRGHSRSCILLRLLVVVAHSCRIRYKRDDRFVFIWNKRWSNLGRAENTHHRGKYHCVDKVLFDRFGFDQTSKTVFSFNMTKALNQNKINRRSAIQWYLPLS